LSDIGKGTPDIFVAHAMRAAALFALEGKIEAADEDFHQFCAIHKICSDNHKECRAEIYGFVVRFICYFRFFCAGMTY
jgi:hypothetical protein